MKTEDIFITDYEIDAAIKFIEGIQEEDHHALHALTKTLLANDRTGHTIATAIVRMLLDPTSIAITVSIFYLIGLHTGFQRTSSNSLEELLGLKKEKK